MEEKSDEDEDVEDVDEDGQKGNSRNYNIDVKGPNLFMNTFNEDTHRNNNSLQFTIESKNAHLMPQSPKTSHQKIQMQLLNK